ncbi:hypothetical protein N657DRAFT_249967 [Parathielavia appendiculata]|uniref:DUF7719 domain-containing protein n=1 Tax=Parathielavia appendiculata TaxID=2587402 RepID=A0AAN6TSR0_9PEZI|nr:hypothetical protein N657DRAFT_249967 [Parathielavia appendiculata]
MARTRDEQSASNFKLKQPDRSGPSEKTLLQLAEERGLFDQVKQREDEIAKKAARIPISRSQKNADRDKDNEVGLPPSVERVMETLLWSVSLAMLHFTFDVLVQHQYSIDRIVWPNIWMRFCQALLVFGLLVYVLHPHAANPQLIPGLSAQSQFAVRQALFFTASIVAGCYLIHITNTYGYLAVMKQAPPIGCLWVWFVIELELPWAVLSLTAAGTFLWQKGYSIK